MFIQLFIIIHPQLANNGLECCWWRVKLKKNRFRRLKFIKKNEVVKSKDKTASEIIETLLYQRAYEIENGEHYITFVCVFFILFNVGQDFLPYCMYCHVYELIIDTRLFNIVYFVPGVLLNKTDLWLSNK